MNAIQLTEREQLIERILRMPNDQIEAYGKFLNVTLAYLTAARQTDATVRLNQMLEELQIELENELEDEFDHAIIEARKSEVGIPLDNVLKNLGFTREELEEVARNEGQVE